MQNKQAPVLRSFFWGPSDLANLCGYALVSLLGKENKQALAEAGVNEYVFYCLDSDWAQLERHPLFSELSFHFKVSRVNLESFVTKDEFRTPRAAKRACLEYLKEQTQRTAVPSIIIPPEFILSKNFIAGILSNPNRSQALYALPVNQSSLLSLAEDLPLRELTPRDLIAVGLRHLHPACKHYFWHSETCPTNPHSIYWPVAESGLLLRTANITPVYMASTADFDYSIIQDSEQAAALALLPEPFCEDVFAAGQDRFTPVRRWLGSCISREQRRAFDCLIRLRAEDTESDIWPRMEALSDRVWNVLSEGLPAPRESYPRIKLNEPLRLSVIMPNYNDGDRIEGGIAALFAQSLQPAEVLIVDDCSTDDSVEKIKRLLPRYPQARLIQHEVNKGAVAAINSGLEQARGDLYYGSGADDRVQAGFFEAAVEQLSRNPQAACCTGHVWIENLLNGQVFLAGNNLTARSGYFSPEQIEQYLQNEVWGEHMFHSASCIYRIEPLLAAGGFKPEFRWACDLFVFFVLSFRYGICFLPQPCSLVVQDKSSYSRGYSDPSAHGEVFKNIVSLLQTAPYADVRPRFARSSVVPADPEAYLSLALSQSELSDFISARLLRTLNLERLRTSAYRGRIEEIYQTLARAEAGNTQQNQFVNFIISGFESLRQARYEEAVEVLSQVIEIMPQLAEAYLGLGQAHLALNNRHKAKEVLGTARMMAGQNAELLAQVNTLYQQAI